MIKFFALRIIMGKMTLNAVPQQFKESVKAELQSSGYGNLADE